MHEILIGWDATAVAVLRCSAQATVLIPVVLGLRWLAGRRLGAAGRWWLWWIVVGRLLLPWSPGAPFSLFGIIADHVSPASGMATPQAPERGTDRTSHLTLETPAPRQPSSAVQGGASATPMSGSPSGSPGSWTTVRLFAGLWAFGFLAVLGRFTVDSLLMNRRVRHQTTEAGPAMRSLLEDCRRRMGVRGPVALRIGAWVRTPSVWGFGHPTILLPARIEAALSSARLRHVLLHELAHVARHDLRWGWVLRLVQALHWFNPAVPWLLSRMRLDREIATDARVLEVVGGPENTDYGETLLALLADGAARSSALGQAALGTTDGAADMEERIRAIASFTPGRGRSRTVFPLLAALAVVSWTNAAIPGKPGIETGPPENPGGSVALLPTGADLGKGWSNRVTSLVDRGQPGQEYFDPGVFGPARELIRSHVREGAAFCDTAYFRDGQLVFDAWLRRLDSTNSATAEWNQLLQTPLPPRLPDGRVSTRISRRVGDLEAIYHEGESRTLWMASGRWMLSLNLQEKLTPDEAFSIAEPFARRLRAGQLATAGPVDVGNPSETAPWYTVHPMGDVYTAVRRVHTNQVSMSRAFRKPGDTYAYFTVTNSGGSPILVWNVRVQVRDGATGNSPTEWTTVSSDYPSCLAGIPAGATADLCVVVPSLAPWRVALLYTAQPPDERRASDVPPHPPGEHEIISATEEAVELALAPERPIP